MAATTKENKQAAIMLSPVREGLSSCVQLTQCGHRGLPPLKMLDCLLLSSIDSTTSSEHSTSDPKELWKSQCPMHGPNGQHVRIYLGRSEIMPLNARLRHFNLLV